MQEDHYQVVIGVAIAVVVLLIAVGFIFMLILYASKRNKFYRQEKNHLELQFKQQLLQSQLEMQEQTFNTISREIHDNVGQVLSLAKVQVSILEQSWQCDDPLLQDVKESISKAMTDLRDIAHSLNTDRIMHGSLAEVSSHELERINRLGLLHATLQVEGSEVALGQQNKLILLRMLQECLQNILKHANARNILVKYTYRPLHIQLSIIDDGVGFNTAEVQQGLGLHNIYERAALVGGKASISSIIQKGTTVNITLPYAH